MVWNVDNGDSRPTAAAAAGVKYPAERLTGVEIGRRVTLHTPEGGCTGILQGVRHYAEAVSTGTIMDPDAKALGRKRIELTLQGWGPYTCSPATLVTVLD